MGAREKWDNKTIPEDACVDREFSKLLWDSHLRWIITLLSILNPESETYLDDIWILWDKLVAYWNPISYVLAEFQSDVLYILAKFKLNSNKQNNLEFNELINLNNFNKNGLHINAQKLLISKLSDPAQLPDELNRLLNLLTSQISEINNMFNILVDFVRDNIHFLDKRIIYKLWNVIKKLLNYFNEIKSNISDVLNLLSSNWWIRQILKN